MLNNFSSNIVSKYNLTYTLANSGDLEAATKTITASSEASSVSGADYNSALTIISGSMATNPTISVARLASRLAVTIDSMTAGHLYCKVYVDAHDADHLLFSEDWTTAGAKLDAVDMYKYQGSATPTYVENKPVIFTTLAAGGSHTFYFFFWVDAGEAVISLVNLWAAPGSCATGVSATITPVLIISHEGIVNAVVRTALVGTGTTTKWLTSQLYGWDANLSIASASGANDLSASGMLCKKRIKGFASALFLYITNTVATDIHYIKSLNVGTMGQV